MPSVKANGIQIEYETIGDPSARPLILIIGLAGQLIEWHEDFCNGLAEAGHYVIRFDNRDSGLSHKFEELGLANVFQAGEALMRGEAVTPFYTLEDMADDAAGLLDALDISKAHICGMSMGGMIAQTFAIRHPARVQSLISIYSSTGNPDLPPPEDQAMEVLLEAPPTERQAYVDFLARTFRVIAGSGFDFDEDYHRRLAEKLYERSFYPQGTGRQLLAVMTQENRKPALASVTAPTLVIHGSDDPLVPVECGRDTADAIPGAELLIIEGMGHELPPGNGWPRILEAISAHTHKVGT
ncbi:MAG: alpha/beta hydrolase [Deltaproteobacteria bacterium]|jgi:pimeloyl-ACP methyl ester carboxylesterase|nr:alpha/beta hydrolase [Deltaproteobacteria bacterium]